MSKIYALVNEVKNNYFSRAARSTNTSLYPSKKLQSIVILRSVFLRRLIIDTNVFKIKMIITILKFKYVHFTKN